MIGTFIKNEGEGRNDQSESIKLREAKATTLRTVLLARSCAMGGEDVVRV
jgi:hypothetical protein